MFILALETHDPFFNLAIEEILLKNSSKEYVILGVNSPSLIIGKHQSPHREINTKFVTENSIPVIRRISGGGAVFHDYGNLNFTFIRDSETGKQVDFLLYTRPVINFLASFGVEAKLEGKSDLKVNGYKISGNSEHIHRNRVLHHGTLLYSTSLSVMRDSLRRDTSNYTTRGVASNPASVANLDEKLPASVDINKFRSEMVNYFLKSFPDAQLYKLSAEETEAARSLAESKYRTWDWNWAYGPEYQFEKRFVSDVKEIYCRLNVREGIIRACVLEGSSEMEAAAPKLIGCRHMVYDLMNAFHNQNINISDEEIFNFF